MDAGRLLATVLLGLLLATSAAAQPTGPVVRSAAPATPKQLRTITEHHGTVVCQIADIARTPCLIVPVRSASRPTRNPGQSTRYTMGRWNVWARSTNRSTFWQVSADQTPP